MTACRRRGTEERVCQFRASSEADAVHGDSSDGMGIGRSGRVRVPRFGPIPEVGEPVHNGTDAVTHRNARRTAVVHPVDARRGGDRRPIIGACRSRIPGSSPSPPARCSWRRPPTASHPPAPPSARQTPRVRRGPDPARLPRGPDPDAWQIDGRPQGPAVAEATCTAGTARRTARFLPTSRPAGHGSFRSDASPQMRRRPLLPLTRALRDLGVDLRHEEAEGHHPLRIEASGVEGGEVAWTPAILQYLTALLSAGPLTRKGALRTESRTWSPRVRRDHDRD